MQMTSSYFELIPHLFWKIDLKLRKYFTEDVYLWNDRIKAIFKLRDLWVKAHTGWNIPTLPLFFKPSIRNFVQMLSKYYNVNVSFYKENIFLTKILLF